MKNLSCIVECSSSYDKLKPEHHVYFWRNGESIHDCLVWSATVGEHNHESARLSEIPCSFLKSNSQLFIGMSSGYIEQIDIDKKRTVARYGQRLTISHGDITAARIGHLACFNGKIYDASAAGLYETRTGSERDDRALGNMEVADNRLLITPHFMNGIKFEVNRAYYINGKIHEAYQKSKAGHLVDAFTGKVLFENIDPFDGSGCSAGKHLIAGDRIYRHHGNWPGEVISVHEFHSGKKIIEIDVPTSSFMTEHNGRVYDLRHGGGALLEILPSDEDYEGKTGSLFDVPENLTVTSLASGGENGLLIGLYDRANNRGRIISHLNPNEPLLECDGVLSAIRV